MSLIEKINKVVLDAFKKCGFDISGDIVTVSDRPDLADYQCNAIFKLSKEHKKNPKEIAEAVIAELGKNKMFVKVDLAGVGFLNFTLGNDFILQNISNPIPKSGRNIVIDYGGPNVAKPLHVGHLRSAIVGESIKRLMKFSGDKIIGDTHLGDFGLQIGQVIYGIQQQGLGIEDLTVDILDEIYPKMSALCKEDAKVIEECARITKDLQDGNVEYTKLWQRIMELSKTDMKDQYDYLDVHFDLWEGEADAYPYFPELEKKLKPILKESDGAQIIKINEDSPPLIYRKANGAYLYASTDLATIYKRVKLFNPDEIVYVVDKRQKLHFDQVFTAARLAGIVPKTELTFCGFGTVNGKDGKPFKTRSGNAPKLRELLMQIKETLKEIPQNANSTDADLDVLVSATIKFADLQNGWERDYIFDIERFAQSVGKTGPYLLYTYARLNSLIESDSKVLPSQLYNEYDKSLALHLSRFPEIFAVAYERKSPSLIAEYLYILCEKANAFYTHNHVKGNENAGQRNNWLALIRLTTELIKSLSDILGISQPTRMGRS